MTPNPHRVQKAEGLALGLGLRCLGLGVSGFRGLGVWGSVFRASVLGFRFSGLEIWV